MTSGKPGTTRNGPSNSSESRTLAHRCSLLRGCLLPVKGATADVSHLSLHVCPCGRRCRSTQLQDHAALRSLREMSLEHRLEGALLHHVAATHKAAEQVPPPTLSF
jgi:hypothetical protein